MVIFGVDVGILSDGEIFDVDVGVVKLFFVLFFGVGFDVGYDVEV